LEHYDPPTIQVLGTVEELTSGTAGGGFDGKGGSVPPPE
jgi:hypothetical protein